MPRPSRIDIVAFDGLHLIYNLAYPALLGTFLVFAIGKAGSRIDLLHGMAVPKSVVVIVYCLDFLLGKKLYERESEHLNGKAMVLLVIDVAIVISMVVAFYAPREQPVRYFGSLMVFAILAVILHLVFPNALLDTGHPVRLIPLAFVLAAAFMCALLVRGHPWLLQVGSAAIAAGVAAYYLEALHDKGVGGQSISVSGRVLDER